MNDKDEASRAARDRRSAAATGCYCALGCLGAHDASLPVKALRFHRQRVWLVSLCQCNLSLLPRVERSLGLAARRGGAPFPAAPSEGFTATPARRMLASSWQRCRRPQREPRMGGQCPP